MSEVTDGVRPRVVAFARALEAAFERLGDTATWSLTTEDLADALDTLTRVTNRLEELRLRLLAVADGTELAGDAGATSTGAWLAHRTRETRPRAHADVKLAVALAERHPLVRSALAAGTLRGDQARVIVHALDALPAEADDWVTELAEKHLLAEAERHDAVALRVLGRRIFDVVDPEAADAAEGRRLEAEEAAAACSTYLQLRDNADGTHTVRAKVPDLHAAMLTKALHALTQPAVRGGRVHGSRPELLGQAFCDLLERLPARVVPRAGGVSPTVLVLLDYDRLVSGLGTAQLDTGEHISAGEARRLACSASVVPVVWRRAVDGASVVLDAGRRRRLHSSTQRMLLTVQDRGCTAETCDRPASWCHAHHDERSWAQGGNTSVSGGRLLCPHHHRKAHSPSFEMTRLPGGKVAFHRRT